MVTIQPLHFEKVTAFKERIQLLNKINEIIAELDRYPTKTEMMEYVSDELSSYYTKEEVNELLEDLDLSDYYTKEEVNTINNLVNYYNITQLNATFENINNRIISGEETLEDEIAGKQNLLTAGNNITITDNVISAMGGAWERFTGNKNELVSNDGGIYTLLKDILMVFVDNSYSVPFYEGYFYLPKGIVSSTGNFHVSGMSLNQNYLIASTDFNASSGNTYLIRVNFDTRTLTDGFEAIEMRRDSDNYSYTSGRTKYVQLFVR